MPCNTLDIYPTILDILEIEPDDQPPLDGISLTSVIDGTTDSRPQPMGFWNIGAAGLKTPSAVWMKELLEAQQAGQAYQDESRLFLNAAEINETYPRDQFPGHAAWLDWPWKLHHIHKRGSHAQPKIELYQLADDPMETTDVSGTHPERVAAMRAELEVWLASVIDSLNGEDYSASVEQ
jgi:arylsulfatase A-like enzyme